MKYIGYHRTSTTQQNLDRGIIEITEFCKSQRIPLYKEKVYTDQHTGKNFLRPRYLLVKEELLESGDVLIITEVDRLGRSKMDTLNELRYFAEHHIRVMILEIPTTLMDLSQLDNHLAKMILETVNNLLIEMYATFAEAEMEKRRKRQQEGLEALKARGEWHKIGRKAKMPMEEFSKQYQRVLDGTIAPFALRDELGMKTSTFYAYKQRFDKKRNEEQMQEARVKLEEEGKKFGGNYE